MAFKTKYFILFVLLLSVILVGFIVLKTNIDNKPGFFEAEVYKINNGYGYSISYNSKLFIKQDNIPTIQKNHPFCNYEDAKKIADLVTEKLNKKENPRVSLSELKMLDIQLNCVN